MGRQQIRSAEAGYPAGDSRAMSSGLAVARRLPHLEEVTGGHVNKEFAVRRPILLSSLLTLFIVVGVVLIGGSFLMQPAALPGSAVGNTEVIRRFYAAANETIATGNATALNAVVAPYFVDQDPVPGMKPDRSGLESYLAALHAVVPNTELLVEAVVADGDRAMARVAVRRGQWQTPLSSAVVDQPKPWGSVDVFRIAGGKVVEHWGQTDDLTLVRPVTEAILNIPTPAPRVVSLDRFMFASSASWDPPVGGPCLLFLETGTFRLEVTTPEPAPGASRSAKIGSLAGDGSDAQQVVNLSSGESFLVPAGARLTLNNASSGEARILIASFFEPRIPGGAPPADDLPPGVSRRTLAGGLATDVQVGPAALVLGQVTLARNARISLSSAEGPALIAVGTGRLIVESWGRAWLMRGSDGMSVDPDGQTMASGDGLLMHQGGLTVVHVAGDGPALVHILTLPALETNR
jgi:predicted SnoaL-like aldol condensation-catalyzing enzyme